MKAQSKNKGGSGSVYTQASTVRVANKEETMALSRPEQPQQQQQDYDIQNHPLSCMDSACEAMIVLFGAGSDVHDEEMTTIMMETTYTNTSTGKLAWETPQHATKEEQDPLKS